MPLLAVLLRLAGFFKPVPGFSVLVSIIFLLAACAPQSKIDEERKIRSGTVVVGMTWEPRSFDPFSTVDSASYFAESLVFDSLVGFDENMRISASLASSFEVDELGREYRFYLRPEARFSNGEPILAEDVLASIQTARSKRSPFRRNYEVITGVSREDAGTIAIRLGKRDPSFLSRLSEVKILPAKVLKLSREERFRFGRDPICSGPYKLRKWISGLQLEFVRNEHYRRSPGKVRQPTISRIVWRVIPEKKLLSTALVRQEIDLAPLEGRDYAALTKSSGDIVVEEVSGSRTIFLGFNTSKWPWDQAAVRQACCLFVDREKIGDRLLGGYSVVPESDFPERSSNIDRTGEPRRFDYNPATGSDLLQSNGFKLVNGIWSDPKREAALSMRILTVREFLEIAQAVSWYLSENGIRCEVSVVEYATLKDQYLKKGDYDGVVFSRTVGPDPDSRIVWSSTGSLNYSKFHDFDLDRYIRQAESAPTRERKETINERIREILREKVPWVFIAQPRMLIAHRRGLREVVTGKQKELGMPWDNPLFNARRWSWGRN